MNITSGKIQSAQKVVIYGPEGIGKSTLSSQFPNPLFIDTEGSTKKLDVKRFEDKPSSYEMLKQQIAYVKKNPDICCTLVIDTIDWAEQLVLNFICSQYGKKGIEDFGYGNGYVYEKEEFGRLLNSLEEIIELGINVVLTAHAQIRKFEQPDEMGAYDRWELKLGKKTASQISPLIKEWADMVLFANYKTFSVAVDDKGKKHKAQGGKRVLYTSHNPCWDAKNRDGLPEELPFEYAAIAHCIPNGSSNTNSSAPIHETPKPPQIAQPEPKAETTSEIQPQESQPVQKTKINIPDGIPKALADLMRENEVDEEEIRFAVSMKGYFPYDTPITNYDPEFIDGVLIGAWGQVFKMIKENKDLPF